MKAGHDSRDVFEFTGNKELMVRLKYDADLIQSITELARSKRIEAGSFTAIGALKSARLAYYDQRGHEYRETRVDSACELASCTGNISIKDGMPFAHIHVVLADDAGNTRAGHLLEGVVFSVEVHLRQLEGPKLERRHDEVTDLSLWKAE